MQKIYKVKEEDLNSVTEKYQREKRKNNEYLAN